jgi:hypothetical protein
LFLITYVTYYTNFFTKIAALKATNIANVTKAIVTKAVITTATKEEEKKEKKERDKGYKV